MEFIHSIGLLSCRCHFPCSKYTMILEFLPQDCFIDIFCGSYRNYWETPKSYIVFLMDTHICCKNLCSFFPLFGLMYLKICHSLYAVPLWEKSFWWSQCTYLKYCNFKILVIFFVWKSHILISFAIQCLHCIFKDIFVDVVEHNDKW